jgi:hypothetical protein
MEMNAAMWKIMRFLPFFIPLKNICQIIFISAWERKSIPELFLDFY